VRPKKRYANIKSKTTPTIKIPFPTIIPEEPKINKKVLEAGMGDLHAF
jgi:hypothetical protein